MPKTIKALIPVRAGSQRVKNKNIRPFAGSSLLEIKIKQLQRIKELDGIIVNSDSDEMLDIAKSLGAETVKRDSYFASSEVSANLFYQNIAENFNGDIILLSNVTSPMIKDETIENLIKIFYDNITKYDSVTTGTVVKEFLWMNNKPLNYDPRNKPRSQDLDGIVSLNHAVGIMERQTMIEVKDIVGYNPLIVTISDNESIDIDNEIDFEFAEFMYKKIHKIRNVSNLIISGPKNRGGG